MKRYVCEKKSICNFSKKNYELRKKETFWAWKIFELNSFSSSQLIKSQKMVRIMKKDARKIFVKLEQNNEENS